ncbi:methyltransferase domain-containing protein [Streptosporangium subroseum]|uniref:methyltransferase domain-containing protein n=1 Tax=Streptosporangium subroseum TaxID=106412 RepID=UPI00308FC705|nr:class I SAM-dependent methyltransferase [Streptosporangium subroseum]
MHSRLAERALVGGALRRRMRVLHTSAALIGLQDTVRGGRGLAIGCGQDYGITVCLERAGAATVDVIDLGATSPHASLASLQTGYDLVGDFAVLQFLSRWRAAVSQVARILRPGGLFHFEVFTTRALDRPAVALLFDHCGAERFTTEGFLDELGLNGLPIVWRATGGRGQILLGVAQKSLNDQKD